MSRRNGYPEPANGEPRGETRAYANGSETPQASHRRFASLHDAAQLSQIGSMPVPDSERPVPPRKLFKAKEGDTPPSEWARTIRKHYDAAAHEPVPDEFNSLMDEIARKIGK